LQCIDRFGRHLILNLTGFFEYLIAIPASLFSLILYYLKRSIALMGLDLAIELVLKDAECISLRFLDI